MASVAIIPKRSANAVMETTAERLWISVTSIPKLLNFHYIVFFIFAFLAPVQLIIEVRGDRRGEGVGERQHVDRKIISTSVL